MASTDPNLIFGFSKFPHERDTFMPTGFDWVKNKGIDDGIDKNLWRIHNDLYDLSKFNHPGGYDFLDITRGTDITELFESSHPNIEKARALLPKYLVGTVSHPRNTAAFTFEPNGFYCTLRSRAWKILEKNKSGPTSEIKLLHDTLLSTVLILMVLGTSTLHTTFDQYWLCYTTAAGFVLALLANNAHNFWHQKNNWRMFSFDLTGHSSHEWRITHGYSHHVYPNTINDYEVTAFEPFVHYLPKPKTLLLKITTAILMVVVFNLVMLMVLVKRHSMILTLRRKPRWENGLPLLLLLVLSLLRCSLIHTTTAAVGVQFIPPATLSHYLAAVKVVLPRLAAMYCSCSFWFLHISLAAGHHHPDIWHAGDEVYPTPVVQTMKSEGEGRQTRNSNGSKTDKKTNGTAKNGQTVNGTTAATTPTSHSLDWGLFQLISVGRRPTVDASVALSSMSFGLHQLHHLFPTVDHSRLPLLKQTLIDTARDFHFDMYHEDEKSGDDSSVETWGTKRCFSILDGYLGMLRQAMRTTRSKTNYPNFLQ